MHLLILVLLMALVIGGILHSAAQADRDIEAMGIEDLNRASEIEVRDCLNRRDPQNDVPHSGAGSEQNPQPALATSSTVPGNVRAAVAVREKARVIREKLAELAKQDLTPDECAVIIGEEKHSVCSRFSELVADKKIFNLPETRKNASGFSAHVHSVSLKLL